VQTVPCPNGSLAHRISWALAGDVMNIIPHELNMKKGNNSDSVRCISIFHVDLIMVEKHDLLS
jgi:hypothetical protein